MVQLTPFRTLASSP